jgi:RNA 3'-terminal phosphate cyclase-like protein
MTNGTRIEINATGTQLRFRPGVLLGGDIEHNCPVGGGVGGTGTGGSAGGGGGRGVGWYLEGIFPLAPFGKGPLRLTLHGITDGTSGVDPSPDYLSASFVPLLIRLGVGGDYGGAGDDGSSPPPSLRTTRRGASPLGGGTAIFHCPVARELRPLELTSFGRVKRVRGTAASCRVPPSSAARVAHSAKGVLHRLLPDVWIHTDVHSNSGDGGKKRGRGAGDGGGGGGGGGGGCGPSPGLGAMLTATTTEGVCLSAECSMDHRAERRSDGSIEGGGGGRRMELPEELGRRSAVSLLREIRGGGCVDTHCQSFGLLMMCVTPEDVSRLRLGPLSTYAVASLRLYKMALGVEFKLRVEEEEKGGDDDDDNDDDDDGGRRDRGRKTVVCSCLGIGYRNMARAST